MASRDYTLKGDQVRAHRLRVKHWTQGELAEAAQLSPSQLSRLEAGKHTPQLATASCIAAALSVPLETILEWHLSLETREVDAP